jgi:hypothetical protein
MPCVPDGVKEIQRLFTLSDFVLIELVLLPWSQ